MFEKKETNKSWGLVGFYRSFGSGQRELFGSDVSNHSTIRLTIKQAEKSRELGRDWTLGKDLICEIELSEMQFAELLTNMNVGDGVPCTIRYTKEDGHIDYKSEKSKIEVIKEERDAQIDKASNSLQEAIAKINELMDNKKLSKTVGNELLEKITSATSTFDGSNYEFYKKRAKEEVAQMVNEAKSQISGHVNNKIYSVGLEHLMNTTEITPELNGSTAPVLKKHKAQRVDDLMYKGCEPHWQCIYCGEAVPFHCYSKAEFENRCCGCHNINCDDCDKIQRRK